ncbi:glycosyltransferase [Brucella thiophenivorans]|uniref:Glycosyl transferases group 1 family protein n=1 Tax=Brucella thiophenivorans TaxID=571255 RepID=A0A256FVT9_9HYPH|nr:glycosyltransferase [Brucella thiophenivorans]OYR18959.1 glycosyl transferases group 1 family protein [Brucella thiophenivorans]
MQHLQPVIPTNQEWEALLLNASKSDDHPALLDVIIPVYKGLEETMRCLYSVCSVKQHVSFNIIVINDQSPDDELVEQLKCLSQSGLIELHHNEENLGFVGTVNYGMNLYPERDVLLLNSDTEVYGDWLDRIHAHAYSSRDIGTVTPLSNNAEICSYPHFIQDNNYELEICGFELDQLAAKANPGFGVDAPTGVGFCMYIKRECLSRVGYFDKEAFGRGYGEENDFCQRAIKLGYRNSILADTYVRHYGTTSFGPEKAERIQGAIDTLSAKHPKYQSDVSEFIKHDPLFQARRTLDVERLRSSGRPVLIFITHNWGGGTERHVQDMKGVIEASGEGLVLIMRPKQDSNDILFVDDERYPNLGDFSLKDDVKCFVTFLSDLSVKLIHVHQLVGADVELSDFIRQSCSVSNIPYDFTVHDYYTYCPRIHLWDHYKQYCGEPDQSSCEVCCKEGGYLESLGAASVWRWRQRNHEFLLGARKIFVPNDDVLRRLKRQFSGTEPIVKAHIEPHLRDCAANLTFTGRRLGGKYKIGLIGALGTHKGSMLLLEVAQLAKKKSLDLEFIVVGYTDRDDELERVGNVKITGSYDDSELDGILAKENPDIFWMASIWPETFSYTLSEVLTHGRWPVAFDFGAIAQRIKTLGFGSVLDIDLMLDPEALLVTLYNHCVSERRGSLRYKSAKYGSFISDYYELC